MRSNTGNRRSIPVWMLILVAACLTFALAGQEPAESQEGQQRFKRNPPVDQDVQDAVEARREELEPVVKSGGDFVLWGDLMVRGATRLAALDPEDPKRSIHFAALEGPEVGTYYRGTAELAGGEAVIELPGYFSKLTEDRGLTVQLTPVGAWSRLYVAERSPRRLVVRRSEGDGVVEFDFLVQGVRRGYAGFQVERDSGGDKLTFPEGQ